MASMTVPMNLQRNDTDTISESDFGVRPAGLDVPRTFNTAPKGGTESRAMNTQSRIAKLEPKPRSGTTKARPALKKSGTTVSIADVKIGYLANIDSVINEIAESAGIDVDDDDQWNDFVRALVSDAYSNPYSDKRSFDKPIPMGGSHLEPYHIRDVLQKYIGTNYRRYVRSFAPQMVATMEFDPDHFVQLIDNQKAKYNLSTRQEAIRIFDGAEALTNTDRTLTALNQEAKNLALYRQASHRSYKLDNSAAATGYHGISSELDTV